MSLRGANVVSDAAIQNSIKAGLLHFVRNDKIKMLKQLTASLTHTSSQSSYLACSFCKVQHDALFCHPEFILEMAIQDMSLRGANVVSDAAIQNSTKAGLLHFVRNDKIKMLKQLTASLTHTSSQSSYLACSFCKVQNDNLFLLFIHKT